MAETEEEQKNLLMRVKEENEKAGLKLNVQKTKIMVSSPITSWQKEGEKVKAVADFIFLSSSIMADGDCRHEIKDAWSLEGRTWKESCDKPRQHIKKQRYHFANKVPYSQSYGFSNSHVQM